MNVYLGADHAGFYLKEKIAAYLTKLGNNVVDVGDKVLDANDDYPQFALSAAVKLLGDDQPDSRAILLCGSGQGMCIAANRMHGIRAALVWNEQIARETRLDNDSNVLCLPVRFLETEESLRIIDIWLHTVFSGAERHKRRIKELEEIYG